MENNTRQQTLPIFSQKLAATLMLNRFNLLDMRPNKKFPDRNVYFFKDSDEIRKHISAYTAAQSTRTQQ